MVAEALKARRFRPIPPSIGWQLDVVIWLPRLETDEWMKKGDGHARFVRRDTDNFMKLALDGVFRAMGEDDSSVLDIRVIKKDGHGAGWIDFVLKEVSVPAEELNCTELAQAINSREDGVRASPGDAPGLLQSLYARANKKSDVRFTAFDSWRLEIMDQVSRILPDIQARVKCPARTGDLNACFGCSDMMVIHCIMCNPKSLDEDGEKVVGLFDLCQQRTGHYVGEVDRPKGGTMEASANKSINSQLVEILSQLGRADKDQKFLTLALRLIYELLSGLGDKNAAPSQEVCVKLSAVLHDLITAGPGNSLPKSILYYKDVNQSSLPDDLKKRLAKEGNAYDLCINLYGEYRKGLVEWIQASEGKKGKGKGKAEAQEPAAEETQEEAQEEAVAETAEEVQSEAEEVQEQAAEEAAPTDGESPEAESGNDEGPLEPVADASVDSGTDDSPAIHEIPDETPEVPDEAPEAPPETPKPKSKKATKAAPAQEPEADSRQLELPGVDQSPKEEEGPISNRITKLTKEVSSLKAALNDQTEKMKKIADAFNALREWLIKQHQQ